jgi:hypothetical protein
MSFVFPHCGKSIMVIKSKEIDSAKAVGREGEDLSGGIIKSTIDAISEKVTKTIETSALGSLENFNRIAGGTLCNGRDGSLSAGWGGAMHESLKKRGDLLKKDKDNGGYDHKAFVKEVAADPEAVSKEKVAKLVQNMIQFGSKKG